METVRSNKTKGQVLVLVTLMLVGLLAMLALVLDGGNLYTQRRAAQLAADAGALAGARAYCLAESDPVGAAALAAQQYVTKNNAIMENFSVEAESGDVTVDTSITFDTFFLHLLGRAQLTAPASATAACSPATYGRNIMPIAWSCTQPEGYEEDPEGLPYCDLITADNAEDCSWENQNIYIIADSQDTEGEIVCLEDVYDKEEACNMEIPKGGEVIYARCDIDCDGEYDLKPLSGGMSAWLDLNGDLGTNGSADLVDFITNGYNDPIAIHTWIPGSYGTETNVYIAVHEEALNDDEVVIPVFDLYCGTGNPDLEDNPCHEDKWHDGLDTVNPGPGNAKDYFHIISFALFDITCVQGGPYPKGGDCPIHELAEIDKDVKTIEGCFLDDFNPNLGGGDGPVNTGAQVVYLKK